MPIEVLMPALSPTMEEGTLSKWLVSEGDEISAGDVIAEIETDKATMEVEAVDEGTLGKILVNEGTQGIKVNTPIALILEEDEEADPETLKQPVKTNESVQKTDEGQKKDDHNGGQEEQSSAKETGVEPVAAGGPVKAVPEEIAAGMEKVSQTVREALRDAMAEEMRRDDRVFVMGEEVAEYQGAYKVTQGLLEEFGSRRVIDTPITEHGFAGVGTGAAFAGLRPIVEFMTWNFAMQAMDHLINSAAKTLYMSGGQMSCPIVFRGPNGPAARVAAQHSQDFSSWFAHVPGLTVIAPYTGADHKGLLKTAIRTDNPVIFLENEILYGQTFEVPVSEDWTVPIGKARIARPGGDVTIVSYSRGVSYALVAAEQLSEMGIDSEIIDLRTLRPLDIPTVLESVKKTNRVVAVEEGWPVCSIGSQICAVVACDAFDYLDAPPTKVSGADVPMPYAANLEKLALPSAQQIVDAVKSVCYIKS